MAQCQAVDCEIKNFDVCHSLENITPPICKVVGTDENINAQCEKRVGAQQTLIRSNEECSLSDEMITESGFRAQDVCENTYGCEWTYSEDGDDLLKKECKSKSADPYECNNLGELSRFSTIDSDTFGCDKINCTYSPKKGPITEGSCEPIQGGTDTCKNNDGLSYSKDICNQREECIYVSNDEEFCGYNRRIEEYLQRFNNNINSGESYLSDITSDMDTPDDPCVLIQNPGREECEEYGCLWDVHGNRKDIIDDSYYYDISSTGLCRAPVNENCMNYFCSRRTDTDSKHRLNDGACEVSAANIETCTLSGKDIINYKTPGFVTFLNNDLSPHVSREGWGHDVDDLEESEKINLILIDQHSKVAVSNTDNKRKEIYDRIQNIYKTTCEKNVEYPSLTNSNVSYFETFNIENKVNKYDNDSNICYNGENIIELENIDCSNFHHKNKSTGEYTLNNSCDSLIANESVSANSTIETRFDTRELYQKFNGKDYNDASLNFAINDTDIVYNDSNLSDSLMNIINKNLECRQLFYKIVQKLKEYLEDPIQNITEITLDADFSSIVNLNSPIFTLNDTALSDDYYSNIPESMRLPKNKIGCLGLLNYLASKVRSDSVQEDSITALKSLLGNGTADNVGIYTDLSDNKVESIIDVLNRITIKLNRDMINEQQYINEITFYIASLVVTDISASEAVGTSDIKCHYDYLSHDYIYDTTASEDSNINLNNIHRHSVIGSELPISSDITTISDYIGIGEGEVLNSNIMNNHEIENIVYKKGNVILRFEYKNADAAGIYQLTEIPTTPGIFTDTELIISYGDRADTTTNILHVVNSDGNDARLDDLFKNDERHGVKNIVPYIGGILEIEIDNIDPGCFRKNGNDYCKNHNFVLPDDPEEKNHIYIDSTSKLVLKEIIFKDTEVDIYFNSDIDGMYKMNDIIKIEGLENNFFNTTGPLQKITEVDNLNNKITVGNAIRRGDYYIGREDFESKFHEESEYSCVDSSYNVDATKINIQCDAIDELYVYCTSLTANGTPGSDCNNDEMCQELTISGVGDPTFKCIPNINGDEVSIINNDGENTWNYSCTADGVDTGGINSEDQCGFCSDEVGSRIGDRATNTECVTYGTCTRDGSTSQTQQSQCAGANDTWVPNNWQEYNWTGSCSNASFFTEADCRNNTTGFKCNELNNNNTVFKKTKCKKTELVADDLTYNEFYEYRLHSSESQIPPLNKTGNYYVITEHIPADFPNKGNILVGMYLVYVYQLNGVNVKTESRISEHIYNNTTHTILLKDEDNNDVVHGNIIPLAIKNNKYLDNIENKTITIENYIRKQNSNHLTPSSGVTNKEICNLNNGLWIDTKCVSSSPGSVHTDISAKDICENTGYKYDKNINYCYKEILHNNEKYAGTTYQTYCNNKTAKDEDDIVNWSTKNLSPESEAYKRPCSVCQFYEDIPGQINYCKALSRKECSNLTEAQCGTSRPGGNLSTANSCEFYRHNMKPETLTINGTNVDVRHSEFKCQQEAESSSNVCSRHDTREECQPTSSSQNATGCEWKCPYISRNHPGYTIDTVSDDNIVVTRDNEYNSDNYYSASELTVECESGWEQNSTAAPVAQCIENPDPNTSNFHNYIMGFVGCMKELNCKNDIYTPENLRNMNITDVPSVFKTDGQLDPNKLPREDGGYNCPAPESLRDNPEDIEGWTKEICCNRVGLCTSNTISTNDITCPVGQEIKMTYYGDSNVLEPVFGTTTGECCQMPEEPTVTVSLSGNFAAGTTQDDSTAYQSFKENFIDDIVSILNHQDSDLEFEVTRDMVEILSIREPFSLAAETNSTNIDVTFKVLKNTDNKVINKEKLSRIIIPGKSFTRSNGTVSNAINFRPFDPKSQYLYWSDTLGKGITGEQAVISVVLTVSLCLFCLVVLGLLLK